MGLFFVGTGGAVGAYWVSTNTSGITRRAGGFGLGLLAVGCFGVATAVPFIIHIRPQFSRPAQIDVSPGGHTLRTDFVATDHGPFRPPVTASVTFEVRP